jgi:hydroxypyruvate reductase
MQKMREHILEIFRAGLAAVAPGEAIFRHVKRSGSELVIDNARLSLDDFDRIIVIGAGKATAPMAAAVESLLGERISAGAIVVKEGHGLDFARIEMIEAAHPVPDQRGVDGTCKLLDLAEDAGSADLVICLISGGGSALMIAPVDGITLDEKQETTRQLLACGASIHEMNTVRKHLSLVKGGRLAARAMPATVISLILSDVVGDDLDVIASGPTVPDPTTFEDARRVLEGHGIFDSLPGSVREYLLAGIAGRHEETPKADHVCFENCRSVLVGTNFQALEAAAARAQELGYRPLILTARLEGEAREAAKVLCAMAVEARETGNPLPPPVCLLCGGEPTVTLTGDGLGGRNQEMALAAALALEGSGGIVMMSGGTDGTDGPTDAAGAIADGRTVSSALQKGLDARDFLRRSDSYHFFEALDDLVMTGPTRTNVMDTVIFLVAGDGAG